MTLFQAATKSRTNVAGVDLRQRPELRMCAEHEIGGRRGPLDLARGAIASLRLGAGTLGRAAWRTGRSIWSSGIRREELTLD
jgi:hypothetical protein